MNSDLLNIIVEKKKSLGVLAFLFYGIFHFISYFRCEKKIFVKEMLKDV